LWPRPGVSGGHRPPGRPQPLHPHRPTANGCVERVQRTILEECWRAAFGRYLIPKYTGLRLGLEHYLRYYNGDRAHGHQGPDAGGVVVAAEVVAAGASSSSSPPHAARIPSTANSATRAPKCLIFI